jgi:DNA-binding response OmpR family regulator
MLLLVEDDPAIGRFIQRGLAGEGHAVVWQRDGAEVRETLRRGGVDAVILDLGLPGVDGLDLCRSLRQEGVRTPIIMLTARSMLQDKLDGFESGADDYLAKPFAFRELLARLNAVIRRDGGSAEDVRFGTLRMNLRSRSAEVGGFALSLTPRAFDVLAVLARAAGEVVSREHLLEAAWSAGSDVTDNLIDVYVGYVRRALRDAPGAPQVATLKKRGFRLVLSGVA